MIDARFSADAFAVLGPNTPAAEELAHALGAEIANEVREAIEGAIGRVVEQLRVMGHDLHVRERTHQPNFHSRGYSFGPSNPPPEAGWLAVHFDNSAFVMYGRAEPEPTALVEGHPGAEEEGGGDGVPF